MNALAELMPMASEGMLPLEARRAVLAAIDDDLFAAPAESRIEFTNLHDFAPGMYARSIFMPAGALLTSRIHKTHHFFVVSMGACTVIDSHGGKTFIEAPYMGRTLAGTKRALHIHTDTVWTTFHPTKFATVEECEAELFADDWATYDAGATA